MNDSITIALLAFLGGGSVLAVVNWLINRRRAGAELSGVKDDQTVKWRDDALHLSDQMLDKDNELHELSMKYHKCLQKLEGCDCPD